jgi:hypothetical protein
MWLIWRQPSEVSGLPGNARWILLTAPGNEGFTDGSAHTGHSEKASSSMKRELSIRDCLIKWIE